MPIILNTSGVTSEELAQAAGKITGWAQYSDTQYTSTSPLIVTNGSNVNLTNNAGNTIKSQLPEGVTDLYDNVAGKITPDTSGDMYELRVDFTAFTTSNTGYGELTLDIGGSLGVILSIPVTFPRGTGISNSRAFSRTTLMYTLDTFLQNGGRLKYESIRGNTSVYDIVYVISRIHKGR